MHVAADCGSSSRLPWARLATSHGSGSSQPSGSSSLGPSGAHAHSTTATTNARVHRIVSDPNRARRSAICYAVRGVEPALHGTWRSLWLALLFALGGCAGELAAFAALAFSMSLGAWLLGRDRARRSLYEAESMRLAIASGQHRIIEDDLHKQLALAAAGEAVSAERQWLARAQLGGPLVAEWRLDEAREIYGNDDEPRSPHLSALAAFGRHELAVLTETPSEDRLEQIRRDRD